VGVADTHAAMGTSRCCCHIPPWQLGYNTTLVPYPHPGAHLRTRLHCNTPPTQCDPPLLQQHLRPPPRSLRRSTTRLAQSSRTPCAPPTGQQHQTVNTPTTWRHSTAQAAAAGPTRTLRLLPSLRVVRTLLLLLMVPQPWRMVMRPSAVRVRATVRVVPLAAWRPRFLPSGTATSGCTLRSR